MIGVDPHTLHGAVEKLLPSTQNEVYGERGKNAASEIYIEIENIKEFYKQGVVIIFS